MGRIAKVKKEDGTFKSSAEWLKEQRAIELQEQREAQEQQRAEKLKAAYSPPQEVRTSKQMLADIAAQQRGREIAEENARRRQKERESGQPREPVNPFETILRCDLKQVSPRQQAELRRKAKLFDEQQAAAKREGERLEALRSDALIVNAVQYAEYTLKACGENEELRAVAMENLSIIKDELDSDLFWKRARELELRIFAAEDASFQAKMADREHSGAFLTLHFGARGL